MADTMDRPYASAGNIMDVLRRYRSLKLPPMLEVTALRTVGVPEGNIGRTYFALQFLGFLDGKEPTDRWRTLCAVGDEQEFQALLAEAVRAAYADVLANANPSTDNVGQMRAAFQPYEPKSQVNRMVTFFLTMCREAGIPTLDTPKQRPTKARGLGTGKPANGTKPTWNIQLSKPKQTELEPPPPDDHKADYAVVQAVIHRLPHAGEWTSAEREQWIAAITAVTDLAVKVKDA